MPISPSLTPARGLPFFSSQVFPKVTSIATKVASTGTGVVQLQPADVLNGLLLVDCQNAQTMTLPTAAALNAGLPGVGIGTSFDLEVINGGAATLTIALGAGITKPTIAAVSAVLTVATITSKRYKFVCTGIGTGADAWVIFCTDSGTGVVA
jgi:hypothetical protein